MTENPFKGAVIFSSRSDVLSVIRTEAKQRGIDPIMTPEGAEHAVEDLVRHPRALLILDWQVGVAKAMQILDAVRSPIRAEIRPIFLFSAEEVPHLEGVCIEYGVLSMHMGEFTRNTIKEKLEEMSKAEPYDDEIVDGLIVVTESRKRDDWQAAGALLEELSAKHPQVTRLKTDLAENYFHLEEYDKAKEALLPLCQLENPDPRALNLLGRVQMVHGDFSEASVTLQKAKVINPFNIERLVALGDAYLNIDMVDRAEINFRKAVEHGCKDDAAIGGLGKSLLMGNKIDEGLVFMKQLSGNREMASVFNTAAVLSMRSGRYVDGMKLYHVALKTIKGEDQVLSKIAFNMGIGFHRNSSNDKAALCFAVAVALYDGHKKAKQNLDSLVKLGAKAPSLSDNREDWLKTLDEIDIA